MKVYFTGAGPGEAELLTVKAYRLLTRCRCCIFAGSLVSDEVIDLLPEEAARHDSAGMDLDEIIRVCERAKEDNVDVVRLHSGDPSIYGAIKEQMAQLDRMGIEYEVIPGISSFQSAAAALKTELTLPEVSQAVVLTRTSGRTPMPQEQRLEAFARTGATLCVFLSVHKIQEVMGILEPHYGPDAPAAVIYHASRPDEIVARGTVGDISEKVRVAEITRSAIIIVGHALGSASAGSKLYDPSFSHGFREGKDS